MPVDDTLPNYAFEFIKDICKQFGPRFSCSDSEKRANLWIKDQFEGYCDEVHFEEFPTHPNLYPQGIIKVCGVSGGVAWVFMLLAPPFSIFAAIAILYALFTLFTELFSAHRQPIYGYLYRLVGDPAHAEELVQDVFLRAYRALPGLAG